MKMPARILGLLCLSFIPLLLPAQEQAPPLDGPHRPFQDELLDHMVGKWALTGTVMGQAANHNVQAEWVLNHQFLRIHETDSAPPHEGAVPYEAMVFLGYDNASQRYVAHWIDVFGGRASETLGYGQRSGNTIEYVFEYPDGPFHTSFRWDPQAGAWHWLMRTRNKSGEWVDFGRFTLTKQPAAEK